MKKAFYCKTLTQFSNQFWNFVQIIQNKFTFKSSISYSNKKVTQMILKFNSDLEWLEIPKYFPRHSIYIILDEDYYETD